MATNSRGVLGTLLAIAAWPFRQFWAFLTNLWTWLSRNLHLRDILLPAIYESAVWVSNQIPLALGGGTAGEMVEASFVLVIATFFTGIVTGGAAWALIAVWILTGMVGVLRFFPVVGKNWPIPKFSFGSTNTLGIGDSNSIGVLP